MKKQTKKFHPMLRQLTRELKQRYGDRLKKVVLFGSHARGEATPDSDMDILVVLNDLDGILKEARRLVPLEAELNLKYDLLAMCFPMSLADFENEHTPFLMNVHRDGVVLYG
jgi:predicted nucleotidyltransferase